MKYVLLILFLLAVGCGISGWYTGRSANIDTRQGSFIPWLGCILFLGIDVAVAAVWWFVVVTFRG